MGPRERKRKATAKIKKQNLLKAWSLSVASSKKNPTPTLKEKQEITNPSASKTAHIVIQGPYVPATFSVFFYKEIETVEPDEMPAEKKLSAFLEGLSLQEAFAIECPPNLEIQIISERYLASLKRPTP